MTYSTRNLSYLRISERVVLPIYVYLDEQHVNWMSDRILQRVLADLRPNILSKLKLQAKSTIAGTSERTNALLETHRGDTYQFCYFVRKTEPHSLVVKSRAYRAASASIKPILETLYVGKRGKRKEKPSESLDNPQKKKRKAETVTSIEGASNEDVGSITTGCPGISARENGSSGSLSSEFRMDFDIEEEEEKPKPVLGLKYQGFSIYGHCLCIVIEPWPVVRDKSQPSLQARRTAGAANNVYQEAEDQAKAALPLFLPEDPEEGASENETQVNKDFLSQILNEESASNSEDGMNGMLGFSQVLKNVADARTGGTDKEDEETFALFGDADEFRMS